MNLKEQIAAALAKVMENPTDGNLKEYENLLKVQRIQDAQEKGVKEGFKEGTELTEEQRFVRDLKETMTNGGTLAVPTGIAANIEKLRYQLSNIRRICTVHPCSGNYEIIVEGSGITVDYVAEAGAFTDSASNPGRATLSAYKLGALAKISQEFLDDSAVNIVEYISYLIGKGFAQKEDHEILFGSGASNNHITGILTQINAQTSPKKVTAATSGTATWAEVKQTIQKLSGAYRSHAKILISQALLDQIHEFKDGGKYMFPQNEAITHIMGIEVIVAPELTGDSDSGNAWMVVGDFSYYHIADRKNMTIKRLNEAFAVNGLVGFIAEQRIDGKATVAEAFAAYYAA